MSVKEKYSITDSNGDVHGFTSLRERSTFIVENPHLFHFELPILKDEPVSNGLPGETWNPINPDHYKNRKYEVFDVMRDTQGYERHIGYLEGCMIKYIMRWDKKGNTVEEYVQDIKKVIRYGEQLIKILEEEQQDAMAR